MTVGVIEMYAEILSASVCAQKTVFSRTLDTQFPGMVFILSPKLYAVYTLPHVLPYILTLQLFLVTYGSEDIICTETS